MKKIISIFLVISFLFTFSLPAFANETHDAFACDNVPVIVVRGMDFGGLYLDCGTENEQPALSVDAGVIIKGLLKSVAAGIFNLSFDAVIDGIADVAGEIFKNFTMDQNGDSLYNVSVPKYTQSADNYENLRDGTDFEYGIVRTCIETLGNGHTYYINYDWRLDPFVVADDINSAVESAIQNTGHKKVNIICCSMVYIRNNAGIFCLEQHGGKLLHKLP